jgi:hypothetical protein
MRNAPATVPVRHMKASGSQYITSSTHLPPQSPKAQDSNTACKANSSGRKSQPLSSYWILKDGLCTVTVPLQHLQQRPTESPKESINVKRIHLEPIFTTNRAKQRMSVKDVSGLFS